MNLQIAFQIWSLTRELSGQVFDLSQEAPDKSLQRIYANLERLKYEGDEFASMVEERLKIIVSQI